MMQAIINSRFNYFLLISFLFVGQSTQISAQTWKEKAKAKYEALQAKLDGDAPTDQKTKSKEKEEEVEEEKKVKIIDLGTHPEQNQVTTYLNSNLQIDGGKNLRDYSEEKHDFGVYILEGGKFVKKTGQSNFSFYSDRIKSNYGESHTTYLPFNLTYRGTDREVFYDCYKKDRNSDYFMLIGDDHIYSLIKEDGIWEIMTICGDKPLPSDDPEVLLASVIDHFSRAKLASVKAYKNYENSKFDLSTLKYEDIDKVELKFKDGQGPENTSFPGIFITMKDGQVHKPTYLNGLMNVSKQITVTPVVKSEDGSAHTYAFEAKHDPRIKCSKTFGSELPLELDIVQNGHSGPSADSRSRGDSKASSGIDGADVVISIKMKTSDEIGDYLLVKVDGHGGDKYHKISLLSSLSVEANGGFGADGTKGSQSDVGGEYSGNGGDGGDGGNGGNVTVIVDPNVKSYSLFEHADVSVSGGKGGSGGEFGSCFECKGHGKHGANGTPGKKGTFTFKMEKVDI